MHIHKLTAFQRKLIFHNIKPQHASELYFETIVVTDREDDDETKNLTEESMPDAVENGSENGKDSENGLNEIQLPSRTQASRGDTKSHVLRIAKLDMAEQTIRETEKKQRDLDAVSKNVGFSKVIRKISQSVRLAQKKL